MAHISDFPLLPTSNGSSLAARLGTWLSAKFRAKEVAVAREGESHWDPDTELMTAPKPSPFERLAAQHPASIMFRL
jgi:hypothetical protein